jgi:peptidoglycan/LPS O-acetylase OafA/YrhL
VIKLERSNFLDYLRSIAIIAVIGAHTAQTIGAIQRQAGSDIDGWLLSFFNQGAYGVQVFFFLSGYLLAMLYGFSRSDVRNKTTKSFWIKRLFRIFPLWLVFFLFTVARPTLFPNSPGEWSRASDLVVVSDGLTPFLLVLLSLTFSMWLVPSVWGGFIPGGWSIQAEMLHYGFFALVRKWRVEAILGAWLFLAIPLVVVDKILSRVDVDMGLVEGWRSQNVASTLVFFLAGCIAHLLKEKSRRESLSAGGRFLGLIAIGTLFLVPLNNVKSGQMLPALGFIAYAVALAYVLSKLNIFSGWMLSVAKYSYFSYFFHFLVLDILEELFRHAVNEPIPGGQIGVGVAVLVSIGLVTFVSTSVGSISWRLLESPFISLSQKISRNLDGDSVVKAKRASKPEA